MGRKESTHIDQVFELILHDGELRFQHGDESAAVGKRGRLGLGACQVVFCEACSDSQVNRACGTHPADAVLWDRPCVLKYIQCLKACLLSLVVLSFLAVFSGLPKDGA